mmetsp:Transcript_58747/g.163951  ORF Transcript_58747/g.163951 Transcript_58747/m.163951 type:complete len:230 (+) Transcript_58747:350-1039(+)
MCINPPVTLCCKAPSRTTAFEVPLAASNLAAEVRRDAPWYMYPRTGGKAVEMPFGVTAKRTLTSSVSRGTSRLRLHRTTRKPFSTATLCSSKSRTAARKPSECARMPRATPASPTIKSPSPIGLLMLERQILPSLTLSTLAGHSHTGSLFAMPSSDSAEPKKDNHHDLTSTAGPSRTLKTYINEAFVSPGREPKVYMWYPNQSVSTGTLEVTSTVDALVRNDVELPSDI